MATCSCLAWITPSAPATAAIPQIENPQAMSVDWLQGHPRAHADEQRAENAERDPGNCAVGLVEIPYIPRSFARQLVHVDERYVVVAGSHPWALRNAQVSVDELAATALVSRGADSGARKTLERTLRNHPIAPPSRESGSTAAVLASARAGLGPAAPSELVVDAAIRAGSLVRIDFEGTSLRRRFHAAWPATQQLADAATSLIDVARQDSGNVSPPTSFLPCRISSIARPSPKD